MIQIESPALPRAITLAVLASDFAAVAIMVLAGFKWGYAAPGGVFGVVFWSFVLGAPVAVVLCLIIGVPAHLILSRLGLTSRRWYVLTGSCIGVAIVLTVIAVSGIPALEKDVITQFALLGIIVGSPISGMMFWRTMRPDLKRD